MRGLARFILFCSTLLTAGVSLWALSQNPFAAPLVERGTASAKVAISRALANTVDADWLVPRIEGALAAEDADALGIYLDLANDEGVVLPAALVEAASAFSDTENGFLNQATDCAACAADISSCKRLAHIASCAVPVELTPIGDLNALRRAGVDWAYGEDVDKLEVGLALAGLGATGLAVGTGGATLPVKAGASLLRLSRHLGALTPGFTHVLLGMADIAISWDEVPDYLLGRIPLDDVADTVKLAELGNLAGDLERVRGNTSAAEVLTLMRHVDTAGDAKSLAKLSDVQGSKTRHTLQALGKSKTFRLLHRLSDLALLTVGLLTALFLQLLSLGVGILGRMARPRRR